MNKCKVCGSKMIELFSSWGCPNDCKGDTPLDPPKKEEVKNIHRRSGCFLTPTEETAKEQKQKMLKALANFNTMASNLINGMTNMREVLDDISIAVGKMGEEMANLHIPIEKKHGLDSQIGTYHSTCGINDMFEKTSMVKITNYDWYRMEYQCDFEPVPMPSIMNQAINAEAHRLMQEYEQKMMEMLGIPRRLLGKGIYDEVD